MQLTPRVRAESGSALVTTMLAMVIMLALGLALLALNDEQSKQSGEERTRDHAFNLAESALTSEAYALSRLWPTTGATAPSGTGSTGTAAPCSGAGFAATIGASPPAGSATARIQPNLSASYNGSEYTGATWQINACDDTGATAVWSDSLLSSWNYDQNQNNRMWIRAQSTVRGRIRAVAGLVDIGTTGALPANFALINGSMGIDLGTSIGSPSSGILGSITGLLLGSSDPAVEGRIGIRCGVYDINLTRNCLGGNGLSGLTGPLLGSVVATNQFVQYPAETAVSPDMISQFRSQAVASGTYVASTTGATSPTSPPACTRPAAVDNTTIWFIEQVGTGDQYCTINPATAPQPKMIVVGKGRLVIRGDDDIASAHIPNNTLNSVVYGLNLQRSHPDSTTSPREVIRIDRAARVVGAVFVDGKSGRVGIYPKVDCGVLGLGCLLGSLLGTLGVQIGQQGPVIKYDQATVAKVHVFTNSGIVPGTFRDLSPRS